MRKLFLSITLALALSALSASTALAAAPSGAQTAPLYGPFIGITLGCGGPPPTPETFGVAVLNTPGDETTLHGQVALKHAAPNAIYSVGVVQTEPCFGEQVGEITTNKNGNGNLHFTTVRDFAATTYWVSVARRLDRTVESFRSSAVELD